MIQSTALRPPAVAGIFYSDDHAQLQADIQSAIDASRPVRLKNPPKALIVPHAGYAYSGIVAASAFAALRPWADHYRRVILIGPAHRLPFRGLAIPECGAFTTPLGTVPLDSQSLDEIAKFSGVSRLDAAHEQEHSLEVELPFLQTVLSDFVLAPILVGLCDPAEVALILRALWYGPETLIVVSSDLSHYHSYAHANTEDHATIERILLGQSPIQVDKACGALPISGLLQIAREKDLHAQLLDYRNSGDTGGDRNRVVGYASIAFGAAHAVP